MKQHLRVNGPWRYALSDLYYTPEVTTAIAALQAASTTPLKSHNLPLECTNVAWSDLVGKADVVEFHGETPYPVEYKHGPRWQKEHDDLQLCAQALCLEEMTGHTVPKGAIFHHSSRRRREVEFSAELRAKVERCTAEVRALTRLSRTTSCSERCAL